MRTLKENKSYEQIRQDVRDYVEDLFFDVLDSYDVHVSTVEKKVEGYNGDWCGETPTVEYERAFDNFIDALTDSYFEYYEEFEG